MSAVGKRKRTNEREHVEDYYNPAGPGPSSVNGTTTHRLAQPGHSFTQGKTMYPTPNQATSSESSHRFVPGSMFVAAPSQATAQPQHTIYPQYGPQPQYLPPQYQYYPQSQAAPYTRMRQVGLVVLISSPTSTYAQSSILQHAPQIQQPPPPPPPPLPPAPPAPLQQARDPSEEPLVRPRETIDFANQIGKLDEIWDKYSSDSDRKEYNSAIKAIDEILLLVKHINENVSVDSRWATKFSALSALHDICESIIDAPFSTLGREVRKHFQHDSSIAEAMVWILESMDEDERSRAGSRNTGEVDFRQDIEILVLNATQYCLDGDWDLILELIPPGDDDAESDTPDEEE